MTTSIQSFSVINNRDLLESLRCKINRTCSTFLDVMFTKSTFAFVFNFFLFYCPLFLFIHYLLFIIYISFAVFFFQMNLMYTDIIEKLIILTIALFNAAGKMTFTLRTE